MPRAPAETKICEFCGQSFSAQGLGRHKKACKNNYEARQRTEEYQQSLHLQQGSQHAESSSSSSRNPHVSSRVPDNSTTAASAKDTLLDQQNIHVDTSDGGQVPPSPPSSPSSSESWIPQLNDIKVEYHPNSGRPTEMFRFEDYNQRTNFSPPPPDKEPWKPFLSRLDFEFAELALAAALNDSQIDSLISLFQRCASGKESLSFSSHTAVRNTWEEASVLRTPFKKEPITVPYKDKEYTYDVWFRPLWEWSLDLLDDPRLAPHFVWDAQRLYKFDGTSWVRFYTEPWTGDTVWNIQSSLPKGANPFFYIIYADKTKLSSFGTAKGYPVMARCGNFFTNVRNGNGLGGGVVVGWIPIVEDDPEEKGKPAYINFKRVVWHASFWKILESIAQHSKLGCWHECSDWVKRWLFTFILILSADYEEQCVMALIRGLRGKMPCPICLVGPDQLLDVTKTYDLRTAEAIQSLFEQAKNMNASETEELFKKYGLRAVENVFWRIQNSDPCKTLSFDELHVYAGGLFSDHLWTCLQTCVKDLGRKAIAKVDEQMNNLPRWRGLNHFEHVMDISFTDGTKYEDISRVVIFALHNVITEETDPDGYLLLQCLCSYVELFMYVGLKVHTTKTLAAGRNELERWSNLINKYATITADKSEKDWNFPKAHSHKHVFDDIEAKGVSRNMSTKINEKLHGPLKASYALRTNFKNVAGQILRADHWCMVAAVIRDQLNDLDEMHKHDMGDSEDDTTEAAATTDFNYHDQLGSKSSSYSFVDLEKDHSDDSAFRNFRIRLADFLSDLLPNSGISLPNGRRIKFKASDVAVTEYRYLKVNYESTEDWCQATDYLRCNPKFHGHPRYDGVVFQTIHGAVFGQLVFLFKCHVDGIDSEFPIALVQPFDAPVGRIQRKDKDLRLFRIRAQPRASAEFISTRSIIRGALFAKDTDSPQDYFVVHAVDSDMFLRLKTMRSL